MSAYTVICLYFTPSKANITGEESTRQISDYDQHQCVFMQTRARRYLPSAGKGEK